MVATLLQLAAAAYLAAGILAGAGLALTNGRLSRVAAWTLLGAALLHGAAFSLLHTLDPPPPLTDSATALSFMAWVGTLSFLALLLRFRIAGLIALVAPLAFVSVFYAALRLEHVAPESAVASGSVAHAHVLLSSGGMAMLGLAGLAGALFLLEYRRLKGKRRLAAASAWPSLEALDRVNALALAVGFPLLTLGVVSGALWVQADHGTPFTGSTHETWSFLAWLIYAVLTALRFGLGQGARRCAQNAIAGFACAGFLVVGVELLL